MRNACRTGNQTRHCVPQPRRDARSAQALPSDRACQLPHPAWRLRCGHLSPHPRHAGFTSLNVSTPGLLRRLEQDSAADRSRIAKALLRWNLLHSTPGTALPSALDNEQFAFYGKTLRGQPEQQVRWKRCVEAVDGALGEALGRVYVAQQFSAQDKARTPPS